MPMAAPQLKLDDTCGWKIWSCSIKFNIGWKSGISENWKFLFFFKGSIQVGNFDLESSEDHLLADIDEVQVCHVGEGELGASSICGISLQPPVDHRILQKSKSLDFLNLFVQPWGSHPF